MPKEKVTAEERIEAAKACSEGRMNVSEAARRLGVSPETFHRWALRYKVQGAEALQKQEHNTVYSDELKLHAVKDYLTGNVKNKQRYLMSFK